MHVYWKTEKGNKACRQEVPLEPGEDHTDAILAVKEDLVSNGESYHGAVLALVGGTDVPK
jgi:hypothetical protein